MRVAEILSRVAGLFPEKKLNCFGQDSLMTTSIPYYLIMVSTLGFLTGTVTNNYVFIFFVYTVLPLMDELLS